MHTTTLSLAVIVLLCGCDGTGLDVTESCWQDSVGPLRGLWEIVSYHENGQPENVGGGVGMQYLFEGGTVMLVKAVREQEAEQVYRCRVNVTLRQIDWIIDADEDLHLTMKGIYLLKGDTLTICRALPDGERPTQLITEPGDNLGVYVLKRLKQFDMSTMPKQEEQR